MIEVTGPDFLSQEETKSLNKLDASSLDECAQTLGKFTCRQAAHYQNWPDRNPDFDYILWACSATWGFEVLWVSLHLLKPEELQVLIDKGEIEEPPELETLNPDMPLNQLPKWAPQDYYL